jgi:hypothetical protein
MSGRAGEWKDDKRVHDKNVMINAMQNKISWICGFKIDSSKTFFTCERWVWCVSMLTFNAEIKFFNLFSFKIKQFK